MALFDAAEKTFYWPFLWLTSKNKHMNILALDTCTELCSAAFLYQGTLFERAVLTKRGHSDLILGMIDEVLIEAKTDKASIDVVAFGRGPGSFTGVRISAAVAQGIAFALDVPVVAISSLAALAQGAADRLDVDYLAALIDARMGEVYGCHYHCQDGLVRPLDSERVSPPSEFKPFGVQKWTGVGSAWGEYGAILSQQFADSLVASWADCYPHAASVIKLAEAPAQAGDVLSPEKALPVYLRNNVAKQKGA